MRTLKNQIKNRNMLVAQVDSRDNSMNFTRCSAYLHSFIVLDVQSAHLPVQFKEYFSFSHLVQVSFSQYNNIQRFSTLNFNLKRWWTTTREVICDTVKGAVQTWTDTPLMQLATIQMHS
jgi:hypothetical protein